MKYCFCLGPPSILLAWILNTNNSNWFTIFARCLDIDISHISAWVSSAFLHLFWHLASHNNQLTHFCFVLRQFAAQHWWLNPHHPTQPSGQIELYNIMCYVEIKQHQNKEFCSEYVRHKIFHIRFHHTLKTTFNWLLKIHVFQPLLCIIHKTFP